MVNELLSVLVLRTIILFFSTTFSVLVVLLLLNIVTVDDIVMIFKLSPDAANALRVIVDRLQEATRNILDILSQLLDKMFSWAGVDIDLSKIKVDVNQGGHIGDPVSRSSTD